MPFQSSQSKEAPRNLSLRGSSAKLPQPKTAGDYISVSFAEPAGDLWSIVSQRQW
jgi:hypothetical protein